jgi:hypothetical protein
MWTFLRVINKKFHIKCMTYEEHEVEMVGGENCIMRSFITCTLRQVSSE